MNSTVLGILGDGYLMKTQPEPFKTQFSWKYLRSSSLSLLHVDDLLYLLSSFSNSPTGVYVAISCNNQELIRL